MKEEKEEQILKCLQLILIPGLGPVTHNQLLNACGSLDECFLMGEDEIMSAYAGRQEKTGLSRSRIKKFVDLRYNDEYADRAKLILEECIRKDISVITRLDEKYPVRFNGISDMPIVLFAGGHLKINQFDLSVCIVGARRCSQEGKATAIRMAQEAVGRCGAVVSGMAKGIDSYAQTAALKSGGYTIAVLGNGPDICYPKEHQALYEQIRIQGCVLSEYPPGTMPQRYMFPVRNRLMAALSDEICVIEASSRSGTMSTVDSGKEYERKLIFI